MARPLSIDGYLAAVLTSAQDAVLLLDQNGVVAGWNPAAERLFGYSLEAIGGRSLDTIVPPESRVELQAMLAAVRFGDQHVGRELLLRRSDASTVEAEVTAAAVTDGGRDIGIALIARDISELKRVRKEVERVHERLKLIQRAGHVGTWEWDVRRGQVYCSEEFPGLYGLPPEVHDRSFQSWMEAVYPSDREKVRDVLQRAIQEHTDYNVEFRIVWPDGSVHWLASRGQVFYSDEGEPLRMMGIVMDVTERRQIDEARRRLAAIVEHSADAIVGKDMQGVITSWNSGAQAVYGYTAEEAIGRSMAMLVPPDRAGEVASMLERLQRGERIEHHETQHRTKDGRIIEVSLSISPISEGNGTIVGASAIARDITERKRAEEALRNSEKLAVTGRLAASIAHEINNPLESVTNLLYLLEHHGTLDENARQYVSMAGEELARIVHITRQTLGFYRESAAPVAIRISDLLNNVLELYSRRIHSRRIHVEKRFGSQPEIRGFPGEMRQVFSNLIVNALEAVPDDGEVKLHLFESPNWSRLEQRGVRVVIADNGPGIPPEHQRRIFEPFYTTKGERGTGLGLWVSNGIVNKYGGSIRMRSSVGPRHNGTVFSVFLPTEQEQLAKAA